MCVLDVSELKQSILDEGHISGMSSHYGATKMYQDLNRIFWWPGMKNGVASFVYMCLTCQKSKVEHQKSLDLIQSLSIP